MHLVSTRFPSANYYVDSPEAHEHYQLEHFLRLKSIQSWLLLCCQSMKMSETYGATLDFIVPREVQDLARYRVESKVPLFGEKDTNYSTFLRFLWVYPSHSSSNNCERAGCGLDFSQYGWQRCATTCYLYLYSSVDLAEDLFRWFVWRFFFEFLEVTVWTKRSQDRSILDTWFVFELPDGP